MEAPDFENRASGFEAISIPQRFPVTQQKLRYGHYLMLLKSQYGEQETKRRDRDAGASADISQHLYDRESCSALEWFRGFSLLVRGHFSTGRSVWFQIQLLRKPFKSF